MTVRNDWTLAEVQALFELPFMDLIYAAQGVHRRHQVPNSVQISTLLSIKTGACPEDCAYCPQSVRFDTGLEPQELLELEEVAAPRARRQAVGRHAFLHGRGLSVAEAEGSAQGARHDPRGEGSGNGDLRDLGMLDCRNRRGS